MRDRGNARIALGVVVLASVVALVGSIAPMANAGHVSPSEQSGNPSCASFGDWLELRIEPVDSGTYSDGTLTVSISVSDRTFSWSSNIGVDAVFVKGGPGGNLYRYSPEATSDSGLSAPANDSNGQPYGLSHISFCYDVEQQQPSSPPPSSPPGPPSSPPPSPPGSPPSSPPATIAPSVLPTRHFASPNESPDDREGTPAPEESVLNRRIQQPPATLPFTGSGFWSLFGLGSALVAAGSGLYLRFRRH